MTYSLGYSGLRALRLAADRHGASEGELAAIDRLDAGKAEEVDVERLAPLARLAELPWAEMWGPRLSAGDVAELQALDAAIEQGKAKAAAALGRGDGSGARARSAEVRELEAAKARLLGRTTARRGS